MLKNKIVTINLLFISFYMVCCCPFQEYESSLLQIYNQYSDNYEYLKIENNEMNDRGFGFWTFNIPLYSQSKTLQVGQQYLKNQKQDGQLLYAIKLIENDEVFALGYKRLNYESLEVEHIFNTYKGGNFENSIVSKFPSQSYEGRWIFHLITFTFDQSTSTGNIIVEVSSNEKSMIPLNIYQSYIIILGGQGYVNNLNLNVFQGRISKLISSTNKLYNENIFQEMVNECSIPSNINDQQIVHIVQGKQILDGNRILQQYFNHHGLNYYISGWVKFYHIEQYFVHNTLIRLSGFQIYEDQKKLGDELFLYEVELYYQNLENSKIIITTDAYCMPEVQSFDEQYQKVFNGGQNSDYQIQQTKKIIQRENLAEKLYQWHYLQYEYFGQSDVNKMKLKITFFNEIEVINESLENDLFNGQFLNSKYYLNFGGDSFNNNLFYGEVYDFSITYQYEVSQLDTKFYTCHSSCKNCFGPLINNCLNCYEENNQELQLGLNICQCKQFYIELENGKCIQMLELFPNLQIEYQELIPPQYCSLGYFWIPKDSNTFECIKCPQLWDENHIFCVDCILQYQTWYIKPVCKTDLIRLNNDEDSAFFQQSREINNYDVYLIGDDWELSLYSQFQDFAEPNDVIPTRFKHLGQFTSLICKYNSLINIVTFDCLQPNLHCLQLMSSEGGCAQCIEGYYTDWNEECSVCPKNCLACYLDWMIEDVVCTSCIEFYGLIEGQCVKCGLNCKICAERTDVNYGNYLKCLKCQNDSTYYFALDGENCKMKTIANCQYSFEVLNYDYTQNSLDKNFQIKKEIFNIQELCALCQKGYIFIFEQSYCAPIQNNNCDFGIGIFDSQVQQYQTTECLISSDQKSQLSTIQFANNCIHLIDNCSECLQTDLKNQYICFKCKPGYYESKIQGICLICPQELNCFSCTEEETIVNFYWKSQTRAFYRRYIELNDGHLFTIFAQSSNQDDYSIQCLNCKNGYRLFKNKCIPYCFDDCAECLFINEQYQCVKCYPKKNGFALSLFNNQCIECPSNCKFCTPRNQQLVNPLFNSQSFKQFSHMCFSPLNDIQYFYDQEFGLFQICQDETKILCHPTIVIELNYYSAEMYYYQDLEELTDENEIFKFKLKNTYDNEFINRQNSFPNYQTNQFYKLANSYQIQTIIIRLICSKNCYGFDLSNSGDSQAKIQQRFSENIYSLKNIELEMIAKDEMKYLQLSQQIMVINFSKITFRNIRFEGKCLKFQSIYEQEVKIFNSQYHVDYNRYQYFVVLYMQNLKKLTIDSFIIPKGNYKQRLFQIESDNAQIIIKNFTMVDALFSNTELFYLNLSILSTIKIYNFYSALTFIDSQIFQFEKEILSINIENMTLVSSQINNSLKFLDFSKSFNNEINFLSIHNSIIVNSSLINVYRSAILKKIKIFECTLIDNVNLIYNSNENIADFNINMEDIEFNDISYSNIVKFLNFRRYQTLDSHLSIDNIQLLNNHLTDFSIIYNKQQNLSSLILIEIDYVVFNNFQIQRGPGLIDLFFINIIDLNLMQGGITQTKYQFKSLHTIVSCTMLQASGKFYPSSVVVNSVQTLLVKKLKIQFTQVYDQPLFSYIQETTPAPNQNVTIKIIEIIMQNNILLQTEPEKLLALISFVCYQNTEIQILNSKFYQNIYHLYSQNLKEQAAGLIIAVGTLIKLNLTSSTFIENVVINGSNSIMFLQGKNIALSDCLFQYNNLFNYKVIQPHLLWGIQNYQNVSTQDLNQLFKIKTNAGCGNLVATEILIQNNIVNQTQGSIGGCFLIETQNAAAIKIYNNKFSSISTLYQNGVENGGVFYITQQSQFQLNIDIYNVTVTNIFCKTYGGFLFINSLSSNIKINIKQAYFQNVYAQIGSIYYSTFQTQKIENLQVSFKQIEVQNTFDGYVEYLNQFKNTSTTSEQNTLINNRTLFFIENAQNLKFQNIDIKEIQFESLLVCLNASQFSLNSIRTSNSNLGNQLIKFTSSNLINSSVSVHNVQLYQLTLGALSLKNLNCHNYQEVEEIFSFTCLQQQIQTPLDLKGNSKISNQNWASCLFESLKQQIDTNQAGLLIFFNLNQYSQVQFQNIQINSIICEICQNGLILLDYQSTQKLQLQKIFNLQVMNSNCGLNSCLIVNKNEVSKNRLLSLSYNNSNQSELFIFKFECFNNTATNGTCLFLNSLEAIIQNIDLKFNKALQVGGALYIKGVKNIIIENSIIEQNQAQIGGGVYMENNAAIVFKNLGDIVNNNQADNYGQNQVSQPSQLTLYINNNILNTSNEIHTQDQIIDNIIIPNHQLIDGSQGEYIYMPSGQSISTYQIFDLKHQCFINSNLTLRILALGRDFDIIENLQNTYCKIQSRKLSKKKKDAEFSNNYTNLDKVEFDKNTQSYNLDNLVIFFNSREQSEYFLQLEFVCDSVIIPIYSHEYPYQKLSTHQNYKLRANFKTFQCQFGEIENLNNYACEKCNSTLGMYSLQLNKQKCEVINEISTIKVQNNLLQLRSGYWRPYFDTNDISFCLNLQNNCLGGWIEGDTSCYIGHIGALCEQCDIYNIRGEGRYSVSDRFTCGTCIDQRKNSIFIVASFVITTLFLFISVQGNLKNLEQNHRFKPIQRITIGTNVVKSQSSILMKMLTNYLQIIVSVSTFQLEFPSGFINTINSVGNPIQTTTYSLDCLLTDIFNDLVNYHAIYLYQYFFIIVYGHYEIQYYNLQFKCYQYNIYLYDNLFLTQSDRRLYLIVVLQKNFWILAVRYDTFLHYGWILKFILPAILILGIIIPLYLFMGLYKKKDKLDLRNTRYNWGYLYNEYKLNTYYWEIIKIIEKTFIILFLNYYEDNIVIKGILVLFTTYLYQELNSSQQPYTLYTLNKLDYYSANICMVTISLAIGAYISQLSNVIELQIPFFTLMALINIFFLYFILGKIVKEYAKQYESIVEQIKELIRKYLKPQNNFVSKLLRSQTGQRKIVHERFQRVKLILMPMIRHVIQVRKQQLEDLTQQHPLIQKSSRMQSLKSQNDTNSIQLLGSKQLK